MRAVRRRRRTWTHLGLGRPKVRMLLSFQRPSHLFGGELPRRGAGQNPLDGFWAGQRSIARAGRIGNFRAPTPVACLLSGRLGKHTRAIRASRSAIRAESCRSVRAKRRVARPAAEVLGDKGATWALIARGPRTRASGGARGPQMSYESTWTEMSYERTWTEMSYERTWTATVRWRGRSSKSSRTSCCQVPRVSAPPMIGTLSEGPISAARRCAYAFVSPFMMLWA